MRPVRYGIRIGAAFVGLATVGLVAVACGGKGNGSATPAATQSGGVQAYFQCLQQHGVNVAVPSVRASAVRPQTSRSPGVRPSRSPGGGGGFGGGAGVGGLFGSTAPSGVSEQTWQAAQQACASLRPSFGPGRNGGGGNNSAIAAYRNCLQDHGLPASAGGLNNLNTADPKVAAAITACAPLRPSQMPGRGPSPTG